jgi:hypothetical protein
MEKVIMAGFTPAVTIAIGLFKQDISVHAAAYLVLPLAGIGQECKLLQCKMLMLDVLVKMHHTSCMQMQYLADMGDEPRGVHAFTHFSTRALLADHFHWMGNELALRNRVAHV